MFNFLKSYSHRNLLLLSAAIIVTMNALRNVPLACRNVSFEDFRKETHVFGSYLQTRRGINENQCAMFCLYEPECKSFNHCSPDVCQLNALDAFSPRIIFSQNPSCAYYGMKRDIGPICEEKDSLKDIKNESHPGACQINQKRGDASWGEFQDHVEIDTPNEWKKVKTRHCFLASHRGNEVCVADETLVVEWFWFIHEDMTFQEAIDECNNLNGQVFHKIDGTKQQLLFFNDRLNSPRGYWLGIEKTGSPPRWQSIEGDDILQNLLLWAELEPTGEDAICVHYNYYGKGQFVHDCHKDNTLLKAACDLT